MRNQDIINKEDIEINQLLLDYRLKPYSNSGRKVLEIAKKLQIENEFLFNKNQILTDDDCQEIHNNQYVIKYILDELEKIESYNHQKNNFRMQEIFYNNQQEKRILND